MRFSYRNSANRSIGLCDVEVIADRDCQIVIVTEFADNPGMSICNAFEDLFIQVCNVFNLIPQKVTWIEYWPQESASSLLKDDEWSLVKFELDGNKAQFPEWQYLGNNRKEALLNLGVQS